MLGLSHVLSPVTRRGFFYARKEELMQTVGELQDRARLLMLLGQIKASLDRIADALEELVKEETE